MKGDIYAKRDHFIMLQEDQWLSARLEELQEEMDKAKARLLELRSEMSHRNFCSK